MIWHFELKEHKKIKDELLYLIDRCKGKKVKELDDNISKTDFYQPNKTSEPYRRIIEPKIIKHFNKLKKNIDVKEFIFDNFWFQQYYKGDTHQWHTHQSSNLSGIYFLELPHENYRTEIKRFPTDKLIKYKAKEGDVIFFPSFFSHRSAKIDLDVRKTVIAFNFDAR
jgi:hypothetical protein